MDYTVASLGGGGFPNAKVIGGIDIADNDSDPMDCEGHGTEVSGVAAGPRAWRPDAKIVAIKVFSSTDATNATCKDTARFFGHLRREWTSPWPTRRRSGSRSST